MRAHNTEEPGPETAKKMSALDALDDKATQLLMAPSFDYTSPYAYPEEGAKLSDADARAAKLSLFAGGATVDVDGTHVAAAPSGLSNFAGGLGAELADLEAGTAADMADAATTRAANAKSQALVQARAKAALLEKEQAKASLLEKDQVQNDQQQLQHKDKDHGKAMKTMATDKVRAPKDKGKKDEIENEKKKVPEEVWKGYHRRYARDYFDAYGHPSTKPGYPRKQPYHVGGNTLHAR